MWDKAQVCVFPQTGHIRDGTIRESEREGEGWRCWRRALWIGREILPVTDSSGANSSTKDRQTRGQHGSLSICLWVRLCLSCLISALCASHCLSLFFFFLFMSFAVIKEDSAGHDIDHLCPDQPYTDEVDNMRYMYLWGYFCSCRECVERLWMSSTNLEK